MGGHGSNKISSHADLEYRWNIMWYTRETGRFFIGFGDNIECEKCHQVGLVEIWQQYMRQKIMSLIPAHPDINTGYYVVCKNCGSKKSMGKWFGGKAKIAQILETGKSATKSVFERMDAKNKEVILKNLKKNGFTSIVEYLQSSGH
jgi:hypothetical protein